MQVLVQITLWCTVIGGIFIVALVMPGFTNGRLSTRLSELPRVGPLFGRLLEAIRMYRTRPGVLVADLFAERAGSRAEYDRHLPDRARSARRIPYAGRAFHHRVAGDAGGSDPAFARRAGHFEGAMEILYRVVPGGAKVPPDEGLFVAFGFRTITITIAIVGVIFYFRGRRDVDAAWKEAEHMSDDDTSGEGKPLLASADSAD